jgi:hypothetical protein
MGCFFVCVLHNQKTPRRLASHALLSCYLVTKSAAYLNCVVIGQGQGGWSLEWGSIHKTVQELFEAYSDALVGGSASVSGEKMLALWRANEKR